MLPLPMHYDMSSTTLRRGPVSTLWSLFVDRPCDQPWVLGGPFDQLLKAGLVLAVEGSTRTCC